MEDVETKQPETQRQELVLSGILGGVTATTLVEAWKSAGHEPVYINNTRIHHWQIGMLSALGGCVFLASRRRDTKNLGSYLICLGLVLFVDDLDDSIDFVRSVL